MGKLKKKKGLKDVTGDGKFTFADVLKMRGVKPKKSMGIGGQNMSERDYLAMMRRLDPKGLYRPDRLELAMATPVRQKVQDNTNVSNRRDRLGMSLGENFQMSPYDLLANLEGGGKYANRKAYEQALQQVYSKYVQGKEKRTEADNAELAEEIDQVRRKYGMGYGGKVKLKSQGKGGTVDYFAGGALAAGLGQIAQMSQNPMIQGIGKVASTFGGMTPAGKAVNMAANYLPALQGLFQQEHGGYVSPKHRLRRG